MAFTRDDLLLAAERSLAAAGSHDRAGWVGLFTPGGVVEDPVGSRPHRGQAQIARFYDTFVGPRAIAAHRDVDLVLGSTVVRDVELEVAMSPMVTMRIPAYIRYDLDVVAGELRIDRLQAFWELPAMVAQFLRTGLPSLTVGAALGRGLLRNQGVAGTAGFLGGFRRVGATGRRQFAGFLDDACAGDEVAVRRGLAKGAVISTGDNVRSGTSELLARLAGTRRHKLIVAGRTAVVGLRRDQQPAVLFADIESKPFAITALRYFAE